MLPPAPPFKYILIPMEGWGLLRPTRRAKPPGQHGPLHLVPEDVAPVVLAAGAVGQAAGADAVEGDSGAVPGREGAQQVVEAAVERLAQGQGPVQLHGAAPAQRGPGADVGAVQGARGRQGQPRAVAALRLLLAPGHRCQELPAPLPLLLAQRQRLRDGGPQHVHSGTGAPLHLRNQRLPVDVAVGDGKRLGKVFLPNVPSKPTLWQWEAITNGLWSQESWCRGDILQISCFPSLESHLDSMTFTALTHKSEG